MFMKKETSLKKLNAFATKFEDDYDDFCWLSFILCIVYMNGRVTGESYARWKDPCG